MQVYPLIILPSQSVRNHGFSDLGILASIFLFFFMIFEQD
jgi:hypothetical protein